MGAGGGTGDFGGLRFDLTYTPGINCFDADVISVHIVFAEYYCRVRDALKFNANPVRSWPLAFAPANLLSAGHGSGAMGLWREKSPPHRGVSKGGA